MSRFFLSPDAQNDLEDIRAYLNGVPREYAKPIAISIQAMLRDIGSQPYLGTSHSHLTRLLGQEVRSRLVPPYRIYYRLGTSVPEVIAILHGARNQTSILGRRFQ